MPPILTLDRLAKSMDCEMAELLPTGDKFEHLYSESGEWLGIRKK